MISFYPGPSRIYDQIPKYVRDAAKLGVMSINHRRPEFEKIYRRTISLLKQKLRIPSSYLIIFTSSATECWEVIAQSLTNKSFHVYNGAFGKKWYEYARKLNNAAFSHAYNTEQLIDPLTLTFLGENGVICLTQNETSNGTQISNELIRSVKEKNPNHLVALDATSSMGGVKLNFNAGDIWFASVQKCFGLPAGMGVLVMSPRAIQRAMAINERDHYNSLPFMIDMASKWQTSYTPNVLSIYLLMRTLEKSPSISAVHKEIVGRYEMWLEFLRERKSLQHLIANPDARSHTVIPVKSSPSLITKIKKECSRHGILLGEGYGDLKQTTFRISNFPAIRNAEIKSLMKILSKY
jgi:phosphoserine aminotransferase